MKIPPAKQIVAFLLGILIASLFFGIRKSGSISKEKAEGLCERQINLALANSMLTDIPLIDKTLQFAQSNRLDDAKIILNNFLWWRLKGVWYANKQYNGALNEEFTPLLLNVYPRVRQQVDLSHFAHWPISSLTDMTNFMSDADAMMARRSGKSTQ